MRRITINPGPGGRVSALGYEVVVEGEFVEVEEEDLASYVNVQLLSSGSDYEWTYRDPSDSLVVGDLVEVPHGWQNKSWIAKVVSLGKGYDGPLPIKDVIAVLDRTELS